MDIAFKTLYCKSKTHDKYTKISNLHVLKGKYYILKNVCKKFFALPSGTFVKKVIVA